MTTRSTNREPIFSPDPEIERTVRRLLAVRELQAKKAMADPNGAPLDPNGSVRNIRQYMRARTTPFSAIARTPLEGDFELKTGLINLIQQDCFHGLPSENPNRHLDLFSRKCATLKTKNIPENELKLRLFPFSLKDKADYWLRTHAPDHFKTWEQLAQDFVDKYFPPSKTVKLRGAIIGFKQVAQESLYEAWERYKDLQHQCPHHGLAKWDVLQGFYNGLNPETRLALDASAGGAIMNKFPEEAEELIEAMASNNQEWGETRSTTGRSISALAEESIPKKVAAYEGHMQELTKFMARIEGKLDARPSSPPLATIAAANEQYIDPNFYATAEGVVYADYPTEQINYVNNERVNPRPQWANPQWSTHPGFNYGNPAGGVQPTTQPPVVAPQPTAPYPQAQRQSGGYRMGPFFRAPQQNNQRSAFEQQVDTFMTAQVQENKRLNDSQAELKLMNKSIMETLQQIQISVRQLQAGQGTLPATTEKNPKANVSAVVAVTTRGGSSTEPTMTPVPQQPAVTDKSMKVPTSGKGSQPEAEDEEAIEDWVHVPPTVKPKDTPPDIDPRKNPAVRIPFPQRLEKKNKEKSFQKFKELLKGVHLNIPFMDALTEVPSYARFLKEIISSRKTGSEVVKLAEGASSVVQNRLPKKLPDPGSFTVPCSMGGIPIKRALMDLGASISLMPLSIFRRLNTGIELEPTGMTIQLADSSITRPVGIARDVILQMGAGISVPNDFVVMEMSEEGTSQIILGRPFMATAGVLIDVKEGTLKVRVGDLAIDYYLRSSMKHPMPPPEEVSFLSLLEDEVVNDHINEVVLKDPVRQYAETDEHPRHNVAVAAYIAAIDKAPPDIMTPEEILAARNEDDPEAARIRDHIDKAAAARQLARKNDGCRPMAPNIVYSH